MARDLAFLLALPSTCCLTVALTAFGADPVPSAEEIRFYTADQMELAGTFYPGTRGARSPCVLLLHQVGGSRQDSGWDDLAKALHKEGFAVLRFDFRGHGASTVVRKDFWLVGDHKSLRGAQATREEISHRDFTAPMHYARLANDVAAAKHVLDLKSNQACDSANVFLVGAGSGATVGALWLAAEWQRWRLGVDPSGRPVKQGLEGQDVAGVVWLSIDPSLVPRRESPVASWYAGSVLSEVPMGFLYGASDSRAAGASRTLYEALRQNGKEALHPLTAAEAIEGTGASGSALLQQQSGEPVQKVANYLHNALKSRRVPVRVRPDPQQAPPSLALDLFGFR